MKRLFILFVLVSILLTSMAFAQDTTLPSRIGDITKIEEAIEQLIPDITLPVHITNTHPISLAFDDRVYWQVGAGNSVGEVARVVPDGTLLQKVPVYLSCRSVIYRSADGEVYIKDYDNNALHRLNTDPFDGSFVTIPHLTGIFQDNQSKVAISPNGDLLYDHLNGVVRVYNFSTGAVVRTINLEVSSYDWGEQFAIGVDNNYIYTFNQSQSNTTVYAHDINSGALVDTIVLGGITFEWSLSYTNNMIFVTDEAETTWYGYKIGVSTWPSTAYNQMFDSVAKLDNLKTLRSYRDNVLNKTDDGAKLVKRLYSHSFEFAKMLFTEKDLAQRFKQVIAKNMAGIRGVLSGRPMILQDAEEVDRILADTGEKASPSLRGLILDVRKELRGQKTLEHFGFRVETRLVRLPGETQDYALLHSGPNPIN